MARREVIVGIKADTKEFTAEVRDVAEEIRTATQRMNGDLQKLREGTAKGMDLGDLKQEVAAFQESRLAKVEIERDAARTRHQIGASSAEEYVAEQKNAAAAVYQIKKEALEDEWKLYAQGEHEHDQILKKMQALDRKHATEVRKIEDQALVATKKEYDQVFSAIGRDVEKNIQGMIKGTETFQQAIGKIGQSMLSEFVDLGAKKATNWISTELALSTATNASAAQRAAAETASTQASSVQSTTRAEGEVANSAATASSGAFSAIAQIPYIGPFLAPAAAMAASMAVKAMAGGIKSFDVGAWDLPQDQLAMVHKGEMIVPATYAEGMRNAGSGSSTAGGGITVNIQATDAASFKKLLARHDNVLVKALKGSQRKFATA